MTQVTLVASVTPTPLPAGSAGAGVFRFAIVKAADNSPVASQDVASSSAVFSVDAAAEAVDYIASVQRIDVDGTTVLASSVAPFTVAAVVVVPPVLFDAPTALTVTLG